MRLLITLFLLLAAPLLAADLTVVTYNIRNDNRGDKDNRDWTTVRRPLVVESIREMKPDIFGVQEAFDHQVKQLAKDLPEFKWLGVGRDDGKTKGEYCAIFYRADRLSLIDDKQGTFWLSDTPDVPNSITWGNACTRIATWAEFTDKTTKKTLCVYNTHWDHRGQPSREKSGDLLYKHSETRRATMPTIIMGDFNATPGNQAMKNLLRADLNDPAPLTLTYTKLNPDNPNSRTGHGYSAKKDGSPIDHVLTTPHWKIKRAWIDYFNRDNIYPSDHYPVGAVLELPE